MLTFKDRLILAQSQLDRAINLVDSVGFPERVRTFGEKMEYITKELTPKLMKITVNNAKNFPKEL